MNKMNNENKMTDPVKVGVIGVGYLGRFHAEKYAALAETELVGVADLNRDQAHKVAHALHTRDFADYRELLPLVSAVSVAVPTSRHFAVVRDCLAAGCQVLVEKPITTTVAEADELVHLSRERGLILMVGHLERFNSAMEELKRPGDPAPVHREPPPVVLQGAGHRRGRGPGSDDPRPGPCAEPGPRARYRDSRRGHLGAHRPGGPGQRPAGVRNGCIANLTASRMSFKSMRKFRLFQPEAYLAVDFENRELTAASRKDGAMGPLPGVALETRRFSQEDVLLKEITAFVQTIQDGGEAPIPGEAGRAALDLALEINAAMKLAKG